MPESIITTGVDKLVLLVEEKKKLSYKDAAKELGVGMEVLEEWAAFLEEEGIVTIEYKFATPYLVKREMTRKEIEDKAKDFGMKKDSTIRKAESILLSIDMESEGFKKIKEEFDKLKKEMETDITKVKIELEEFEKYSKFKKDIDQQMLKDQHSFKEKLDEIQKEVEKKKADYASIIENITKKKEEFEKQATKTKSTEESEAMLKDKLKKIAEYAIKMEKDIDVKLKNAEDVEKYTKEMLAYIDKVKKQVESKKSEIIQPLIDKSKEYENKIINIQKNILDKVLKTGKEVDDNIQKSKVATQHFKDFFDKRMNVEKLLTDVDKEKIELEREIRSLIEKARAFELGLKTGQFKGHAIDLEKTLKEIERKKGIFELTLKKLGSIIKS